MTLLDFVHDMTLIVQGGRKNVALFIVHMFTKC